MSLTNQLKYMIDAYSWMIEFFKEYGYWAVFIGSMFEGETLILAASAMASAGYMSIEKVVFFSFLGSMISDQSCFLIGYKYGDQLLIKFPRLKKYHDKAINWLSRFETLFIFGFRFIYGVRNVSPFLIGSAKISIKKFFILNILAAFTWAVISCALGYYLGEFILTLSSFQKFLLLGSVGFIFIGFIIWKLLKSIRSRNTK